MSTSAELARVLLAALDEVPGLRPARPVTAPGRLPWDTSLLAVDVDGELVTMRLVASQLPLPPLLAQASKVLRAALARSGHAGTRLRLEVTGLDRAAFGRAPAGRRRAPPGR